MKYKIKGYFLIDGKLDCRFICTLPSFEDVIAFCSGVNLVEAYEVVHINPDEETKEF